MIPMIEVIEEGSVVSLLVDGAEQSRVDRKNPGYLEFEYMQHMDAVLRTLWPEPHPIRAAHIGGGLCALPWAWETLRPASRQVVFEVDSDIADLARLHLPLPRKPLLRIRVADGRQSLEGSKAHLDVIVRDAFKGRNVPPHLSTLEWNHLAQSHLNGLYLANTAHGKGTDARPDIAATSHVFAETAIIGDSKVLKSARWGNLVVAATSTPGLIDWEELDRKLRRLPLPARLVRPDEISRWLGGASPLRDPLPTA